MSAARALARRLRDAARLIRRLGVRQSVVRGLRLLNREGVMGVLRRVFPALPVKVGGGAKAAGALDLDLDFSLAASAWASYLAARRLPVVEPVADLTEGAVTLVDLRACVAGSDWLEALLSREGDSVALFIDPGDAISPLLLEACTALLAGDLELLTFDAWREADGRAYPLFAPGANATALRAVDLVFSRFALRVSAAARVARGTDAAIETPYDLLRAWLCQPGAIDVKWRWRHDPRPLARLAIDVDDRTRVREAALARAKARPCGEAAAPASVSVVICSKDKGFLLDQIVRGVRRTGGGLIDKIVVVANNTSDPHAHDVQARLAAEGLAEVVRHDAPFNFSRLTNLAAKRCDSPFLLVLNDDVIILSDGWLEALLAPFDDPTVGVTGPLLLYPDESVQHAGMYVGFHGSAGHALRRAAPAHGDYQFMLSACREVSAVTGAAMLLRMSLYRSLTGFDEGLATHLQDVDLCLRAGRLGYRIVHTPLAPLLHLESISAAPSLAEFHTLTQRGREHARFVQRWGALAGADRFHSRNFDTEIESMRRLSPP